MKKIRLQRSVDVNILLVALMYYLTSEIGFFLAFDQKGSLPFWPPSGIALALIVLLGRKVWPGIAIGSLIITVKNFWFGSIDSVQLIMAVAVVISIGRVLEPLAGDFLLHRLVRKTYPFSTTLDAFQFVLITLVISIISSGIATVTLVVADVIPAETLIRSLVALWIRNVAGLLLFTPLLLAIPHALKANFTFYKAGEMAAFLLGMVGVFFLFNLEVLRNVAPYALPFVVIPFLLWLAFRFDIIASIIGFVLVSLVAIYFTGQKLGPFYIPELTHDSILLLQVYIGVISVSALVLASAVNERQGAQSDLKKFSENLEVMVQERTKALKDEIRNRHEAQKKLQTMNEELIKRNTELDNFVYSVSHDLRAPMSSILGLINLAKKDKGQQVKNLYLDMMEKSAQQQDHFISEILDQSRNSRLELKREPVQFEALVEETFEQLNYSNPDGRQFEKVVTVRQSEPFYCDKWRLKVVLNNIISNSIRYRNGRDPVIKVEADVFDHKLNVCVEDNGRGINKKHLSNLGTMFYRATDEGAGSGLGLYIVKEAVDKLKGSMAIESEEGQWTKVKLEIPEVTL